MTNETKLNRFNNMKNNCLCRHNQASFDIWLFTGEQLTNANELFEWGNEAAPPRKTLVTKNYPISSVGSKTQ